MINVGVSQNNGVDLIDPVIFYLVVFFFDVAWPLIKT